MSSSTQDLEVSRSRDAVGETPPADGKNHDQGWLLAAAGEVFADPVDAATAIRRIAGMAADRLSDWCVVYLLGDGGEISRYEVACRDPANQPVADRLRDGTLDRNAPCPVCRVLDTGAPEVATRAEPASFLLAEPDEGARTLELAASSYMVFPLRAGSASIGAMAFIAAGDRAFDEAEVWIGGELARRTALAVDNARLLQTARQAVLSRDRILRMVSHDLGTPLESILAAVDRVMARWSGGVPGPRDLALLGGIRQSAEQMRRLVRDLLDVHEIEAGRFSVEPRPIALVPVLQTAQAELDPIAEEAGITLVLDAPAVSPMVLVDEERVVQLLGNLISNAIRFSPAGERVVVAVSPGYEEVTISVTDRGPGIDPEDLPTIFDWRSHSERTHRGGAGLGLAISRQIAHAHGGRLRVDSEPGRGSTFEVTLPLVAVS